VTNVVGSNIFNIAFILGLCALVSPLTVSSQLLRFDTPIFIISSIFTFIFSSNGNLSFWEGAVLTAGVVIYTGWLLRSSRGNDLKVEREKAHGINKGHLLFRLMNLGLVSVGIVSLVYGSKFLVRGASEIALRAGISESVIGLTLVAAGTSLPELVSSLMATIRGKSDIAIGNVIGSGIFNLLFILGSSTLFSSVGLNVTETIIKIDLPVMILLGGLSYRFLKTKQKLHRWEGLILLIGYLVYTGFLFTRN
jgi:cation:H+ antiporter